MNTEHQNMCDRQELKIAEQIAISVAIYEAMEADPQSEEIEISISGSDSVSFINECGVVSIRLNGGPNDGFTTSDPEESLPGVGDGLDWIYEFSSARASVLAAMKHKFGFYRDFTYPLAAAFCKS